MGGWGHAYHSRMDKPPPPRSALIVHAGAWDIPEDEKDAHLRAVSRGSEAGWGWLADGASALEVVRDVLRLLEDDAALNAGVGSVLCREGWVEADAALMDGSNLAVGAIAAARTIRNPILAAHAVMGSEQVLLAGSGADRFAALQGIELVDAQVLVTGRERNRLAEWQAGRATGPADTVGAVAVDLQGHIAAGTSTGGRVGKLSGRIGDAPIPGAGLFADDLLAGVACTGRGEEILRLGLARRAADLNRDVSAQDACWLAVRELEERVGGEGGLVLISRDGSIGFAFNTPSMPVAYRDEEMDASVVTGVAGR